MRPSVVSSVSSRGGTDSRRQLETRPPPSRLAEVTASRDLPPVGRALPVPPSMNETTTVRRCTERRKRHHLDQPRPTPRLNLDQSRRRPSLRRGVPGAEGRCRTRNRVARALDKAHRTMLVPRARRLGSSRSRSTRRSSSQSRRRSRSSNITKPSASAFNFDPPNCSRPSVPRSFATSAAILLGEVPPTKTHSACLAANAMPFADAPA
jgi:hypothetical protein